MNLKHKIAAVAISATAGIAAPVLIAATASAGSVDAPRGTAASSIGALHRGGNATSDSAFEKGGALLGFGNSDSKTEAVAGKLSPQSNARTLLDAKGTTISVMPTDHGQVCIATSGADTVGTCVKDLTELKGHIAWFAGINGDGPTALGVVADDVTGVTVVTADGKAEATSLHNNAFKWAGSGTPTALHVTLNDGSPVDVQVQAHAPNPADFKD